MVSQEDQQTDLRNKQSIIKIDNFIKNYESNCLITEDSDIIDRRNDIRSLQPYPNKFLHYNVGKIEPVIARANDLMQMLSSRFTEYDSHLFTSVANEQKARQITNRKYIKK